MATSLARPDLLPFSTTPASMFPHRRRNAWCTPGQQGRTPKASQRDTSVQSVLSVAFVFLIRDPQR